MQNFIECSMSEARTFFILLPLQVSLLRRKYVKKIIFKNDSTTFVKLSEKLFRCALCILWNNQLLFAQ
jgi:hypothetical protein